MNVTHVAPLPPTPFEKYLGAVCSQISIALLDVCTLLFETCLNYYTVGGNTACLYCRMLMLLPAASGAELTSLWFPTSRLT